VILKVCREQAALAERSNADKKARLAKQQAETDKRRARKKAKREAALKAATVANAEGDDEDDDMPSIGTNSNNTEKVSALPKASSSEEISSTPVQKLSESTPVAESTVDADEEDLSKGAKPSVGNGGQGPNYEWIQTLKDLVISVPMPLGTRGKHLTVKMTKDHITVGRKGETPLINGKLHKPVRPDELIWTIDDNDDDTGRILSIEVPKKNQMEWWKCIVQGHEEIDTSKVEPENSKLDDLDRDTRQTVEKMMFDQRQKAMNKPTSDEMKKENMLQKFMEQHPEMDFSNVKMS
jgi:hypothetical protein